MRLHAEYFVVQSACLTMKLLFRPARLFAAFGIFLLCASQALLAAENPAADGPQEMGMMVMPKGVTAKQVKVAIVAALTNRKWLVKSADDSTVVGYLKHRGTEATLTFRYDENEIEIISDSYEIDSDGKRLERKNPIRWIDYLKQDILHYLTVEVKPAK